MTGEPLYTGRFWHLSLAHFLVALAALSLPVQARWFHRVLGADEAGVGVIVATAVLAGIVFRPAFGRLLDHSGRRSAFLVAGVCQAVAFFLYPAIDTFGPALLALRVLHGIGLGGLFGAFFTYAADIVPARRRAEGIAVFGASGLAAHGLGPVLAEALERGHGFEVTFVAMGILSSVSLVLTLGLPETRPAGPSAGGGFLRALTSRSVAVLWPTTALFGCAIMVAMTYVGLLVDRRGLPGLGPFFLTYAAVAIAIRLVGSRLLDAVGVARAVLPASVPLAGGLALLSGATEVWHLVVAGAAAGLGHGVAFPALGALAVERAAPGDRGAVVTVFTGMMELGGLVGNPLFGWLAEARGLGFLFAALSGSALLAGILFVAGDSIGRR